MAAPAKATSRAHVERPSFLDVHHADTYTSCSQVRFELAFKALNPTMKIIAPWRMPEFIQRL